MTCHAFETAWNALLDAETSDRRALAEADPAEAARLLGHERAAAAHVQSCGTCAARHRQYQTLRRALRAGPLAQPTAPAPSPALAERILDRTGRIARRSRPRRFVLASALALAASVGGLLLIPGGPRVLLLPRRSEIAARPIAAIPPPRLGDAMADATTATWDLARTTSEPAARLGRRFLDAAIRTDAPDAAVPNAFSSAAAWPLPSVLRTVAPAAASSDLLQGVGDELSAGVRPLSARAREAFKFLRTPLPRRGGDPPRRPPLKGA